MSWVTFDDKFPFHRKVAGLSDAAFRLHTTAIFWCRDNGTDGLIPNDDVNLVVPRLRQAARYAAECARREVWHDARHNCPSQDCPAPVDADGWVVHDYFSLHPTKAETATALANASAAKSDGGKLGNHRKWHRDGRTSPSCPYCTSVSDRQPIGMRSDTESDSGSPSDRYDRSDGDRQVIALSRSRSDTRSGRGSVIRSRTDRNARTDDDLIQKTIIETIAEVTGRSIDARAAAKIAAVLLGDRSPQNPAAYCRKAITNDPDPVTRFAISPPPRPPWCGECDEQTRMRSGPGRPGALEETLTPCHACHPSKVRTA
jgi:hypothetical protein